MATGGNSLQSFDISDISEGCNYADDIKAIKKNQSPDSLNVVFFNGRWFKRDGSLAINSSPTSQGGIDSFTKLMLHCDGTNTSTTFTDSELTPKAVTSNGGAMISTTKSKLGGASGYFNPGIDSNTVLMLHCDGVDTSTTFTDSSTSAKTVTANGAAQLSTGTKKFGTASGSFNGTNSYLTIPDSADWVFGTGDFTIDCWLNPTALDSGTNHLAMLFYQAVDGSNFIRWFLSNGGMTLQIQTAGVNVGLYSATCTVSLSTWTHLALVRSGSSIIFFINGVAQSTIVTTTLSSFPDLAAEVTIGKEAFGTNFLSGFLDEYRVTKGTARWTTGFTVPQAPYSAGAYLTAADAGDWGFSTGDFTIDFWVNFSTVAGTQIIVAQYGGSLNNFWQVELVGGKLQMVFVVGGVTKGSYIMTSSAGFSTETWYHLAFVRDSTTGLIFIDGVSQTLTENTAFSTNDVGDIASSLYIGQQGSSSGYFDGYIDELRISKGVARWTIGFTPPAAAYDTFNAAVDPIGFSLVDFSDSENEHQQIAHLGNFVYKFDRISSSSSILRANAPYVRSYNAKVSTYLVQTYNDYSTPYYWDGDASTMAVLSVHAPGFKRSVEFQGYFLGMNTSDNPTRCYYQPIGNFIGSGAAYTDYFTLTPAPNDDEISDPFLLNGRLYAGTKYGIFRISFVGGVTVFEFKQVITDVGIVPNTVQNVVTKQFGQVAIFLGTDKRLYMFDGANVKTISDLFYNHNDNTPISLDLIDDSYKENSFAVYDYTKRVYRLMVTKKAFSMNQYCMNLDVDTFAYYPFDNMAFSSGAICYDSLLKPYVVFVSYLGILNKMFIKQNTDNGTAINEYYTSPLVTSTNNVTLKAQMIGIRFKPTSNAKLQIYDKVDFSRAWSLRDAILLAYSRDKFLGKSFVLGSAKLGSEKDTINAQVAIKSECNYYQFKLVSDTPTAPPWEILEMNVNSTNLKIGKAEAQR